MFFRLVAKVREARPNGWRCFQLSARPAWHRGLVCGKFALHACLFKSMLRCMCRIQSVAVCVMLAKEIMTDHEMRGCHWRMVCG
jgi:hypothetical protein